jgi:tetratricopeptide (TPR) repeat protein
MVIQIRPGYHGAFNNLSIFYSELNDLDKAREFAEFAVTVKPKCPDYLYTQGCVLSKPGNNEEALGFFKKADKLMGCGGQN